MTWNELREVILLMSAHLIPEPESGEFAGLDGHGRFFRIQQLEELFGLALTEKLRAAFYAGEWPPVLTERERWLAIQRTLIAQEHCSRAAARGLPLPAESREAIMDYLVFWTPQKRSLFSRALDRHVGGGEGKN